MALELFRPFIIDKVIERGLAYNIKNSNRLIDQALAFGIYLNCLAFKK